MKVRIKKTGEILEVAETNRIQRQYLHNEIWR